MTPTQILLLGQRIICLATAVWSLTTNSLWVLTGVVSLVFGFGSLLVAQCQSPPVSSGSKAFWVVLHAIDTVLAFLLVPLLFGSPGMFFVVFGMVVVGNIFLPPRAG